MNHPNMPSNNNPEFNAPLCGCCNNLGVCFLAACCPCVQFGKNAARIHGQDVETKYCLGLCCVLSFLPPLAILLLTKLRGDLRNQYGIQGSCLGDCLTSWCCALCTQTQMAEELDIRSGGKFQNFN